MNKSFKIFGTDVSKMPCFRNSYLYGIGGGIGIGLTYFMLTSRTKASCHFGVASFAVITLSYWTQCRYNYSKLKFDMARTQELMKKHSMYEGTEMEKKLQGKLKEA